MEENRNGSLSLISSQEGIQPELVQLDSPQKTMPARSSFLYRDEADTIIYRADYDAEGQIHYLVRSVDGSWTERTPELMVPYNLPALYEKRESIIFVTGDEFDVEALQALGVLATCGMPHPNGGYFPKDWARHFVDRLVILIDSPFMWHREITLLAAEALKGVARTIEWIEPQDVEVIETPFGPSKERLYQWLQRRAFTREAFGAWVTQQIEKPRPQLGEVLGLGEPKDHRGDAYEGDDQLDDESDEDNYLPDWKDFPVDALPLVIGDFSVEYGNAIAVHPASMALFSLATLAGCIGSSRVIRLTPTWTEPAIIFGNLICEPSTRKSAALEASTEPAEEWNSQRLREHKDAEKAYEADLEIFMAWLNSKQETGAMGGKPVKPKEPVRRRLIVKDITVETFIRELGANPRGLFMPCDELRMFFASFGKYSKAGGGSDECFWLSVFNGRKFDYDRKTGDKTSVHIDRLIASICGGVTPGCWRSLACQAMYDSGMMGRILLMWPPKVRYQVYTAPRPETTRAYFELMQAVLGLDYEASLASDWKPIEMRLTPSAAAVWEPWLVQWRHRQYDADGETAALLGKIEAYCARFALLGSVCDLVSGGFSNIVEECHVRNAIILAEWFAIEAERIYLHGDIDSADAEIAAVIQKVRERGERGITPRELWHSNRRRWRKIGVAKAILKSLAENEDGRSAPLVCRGRRYFLRGKK